MEASLQSFVTAETAPAAPSKPCHSPVKKAALATQYAPDVRVPLRFMVFGFLSLAGAAVVLAIRPGLLAQYHYSPEIVAMTHWIVLGFLMSVVAGALYQLTPVALETRLHSERLARLHFLCHAIGVPGMVWMFWTWNMKQLGHYGSLFGLGIGLMAWNLHRTQRNAPNRGPVRLAIVSSTFWITATMVLGLFLASSKCWPVIAVFPPISAMHAHAHLGIMGGFSILIIGVSYRLVPMFLLGELQNERRAIQSIRLLNASVAGLAVTLALGSPWKLLFAVLGFAGILLFAAELTSIVRHRRRRSLDWGMIAFLTAVALFLPLGALGLFLAWPGLPPTESVLQLENAYGLLAILGVVGFAIFGMVQKILPFLVWYKAYADHVGLHAVPSVAELHSRRLPPVCYGLYLAGLAGTIVGAAMGEEAWIRPAWWLLTAGVLLLLVNLGLVLSHWFHPRFRPLDAREPATPALS